MAIVNKRLTTTQLDAITVPSGKTFAITNVLVCNNTTTDCNFDIYLVNNYDSLVIHSLINNITDFKKCKEKIISFN